VAAAGESQPMPESNDELIALRAIVEGTASVVGDDFFRSLVKHLAAAMNVGYAFVAEFTRAPQVRTLAYWKPDGLAPNVEWDVRGTPCEDVVKGKLCHYPTSVAVRFPEDAPMVDMGIDSYLGVPLLAPDGRHLGHLAVFDTRPMPDEPRKLFTFRIFAARAAGELERLRMDRALRESERRYRDLYEEAPIAYIYEDLESRFVRANRAACELLGIRPEEVTSTIGKSLLAPTPEVQQKIRDALDAMKNQGKQFAGVELELRRKDDGRPVWVQWWSKPEPDGQHTRTMLVDVSERVLMERENLYLQEEIKQAHNFEEIVGQSNALLAVLDRVRRVAPTDASVLITGETGTGKELFARAIHSSSTRKDKPLIKVNCAALPTGLVESELFGHEKGSFSGAISKRIGRFELAHGGTIFLDEIGEIPLEVQAKLLRVLQEREFERVGGASPIRADVRIIAATNRDLEKSVHAGTFRADLFYRLNVFPLALPPLRDRADDLPLLTTFLISKFASRVGRRIESISKRTMERMSNYHWPGNIRELENVLERAVILSSGPMLEIDESVFAMAAGTAPSGDRASIPVLDLDSVERNHILSILKQTNWVIEGAQGAATLLNLHPNTLRSRLKKMGISRPTHEVS
jgi:PAS domain S-box-containing protein